MPLKRLRFDADPATENALYFPSLGTVPVKTSAHSERQRAHKNDVPWSKKLRVQGHKVSKTLSNKEREWIDDALLRMKVLLGTGALVCVTMKPKHLDALGPVKRMEYWKPFVNRFRSYRKSRCKALKKKLSWWEVRCVWVRESDPDDDLGEHFHWILVCPTAEEADLFIEHVQDTDTYEGWGDNTHAMRIDAKERMVGGKLSSFFNYVLKAAHPRSRFADHTIGWKPSGALVGKRYFITKNLTDPEVIAQTEVGVATLKRVREEKKLAAFRRRAQANRKGLYSYAATAAELPAIEPAPAEEADYLTHEADGAAGPVHREAERRDVPAEAPVQDDARAPARAEAQDAAEPEAAAEVEAETPTTPAGLGTPAQAAIISPVSAEPGPLSSSPKAVLVSIAAHGRAAIPRRPRRGGYPSTGFTGIPPPPTRGQSTVSARQARTAGRARAPPRIELPRTQGPPSSRLSVRRPALCRMPPDRSGQNPRGYLKRLR